MAYTVEQILERAAARLGDPGAQYFTPELLTPSFQLAWDVMIDHLRRNSADAIDKVTHYLLPARASVVLPASLGVTDFGGLLEIRGRADLTIAEGTAVSASTPVELTVPSHPFVPGQHVVVIGSGGGADGAWNVDIVDPDTIRLLGSRPNPNVAVTAPFTVLTSRRPYSEPFHKVEDVPASSSQLEFHTHRPQFAYRESRIDLQSYATPVELRIKYSSDGTAPVSGDTGVPKGALFLVEATAKIAAEGERVFDFATLLSPLVQTHLLSLGIQAAKEQSAQVFTPAPFRSSRRRRL